MFFNQKSGKYMVFNIPVEFITFFYEKGKLEGVYLDNLEINLINHYVENKENQEEVKKYKESHKKQIINQIKSLQQQLENFND